MSSKSRTGEGRCTAERAENDSANPLFEQPDVEINQETNLAARQVEVGQQLRFVDWRDLFDRFQLDNDLTIDEQVDSIATVDKDVFVNHRQSGLALKIQLALSELMSKTSLIGRFK